MTTTTLERPRAKTTTDALYEKVSGFIPKVEWATMEDDVEAILRLKAERNAVVLAHNYQTPEIFHTVSDIVGDSLALAREAVNTEADVIVLAGVHFMAETAKLLNPDKTVLIPDMRAGCSLADSITAEDIALLRQRYPGVPVVTYVNTSAAVKAASDICCTSGNAHAVIRSLNAPRVLMLPDEYLARNVQRDIPEVEILTWAGHCEVHEKFTPQDIRDMREAYPGVVVLAHPECPQNILEHSDFIGGTEKLRQHVMSFKEPRIFLVATDAAMIHAFEKSAPQHTYIPVPGVMTDTGEMCACNRCPHMARNTLAKVRDCLKNGEPEIHWQPYFDQAREVLQRSLLN